jgi:hypothetical protein
LRLEGRRPDQIAYIYVKDWKTDCSSDAIASAPEAQRRRRLREWPHAERTSRTTDGLGRVDPEHRLERIDLVHRFYGIDPVDRISGIDPVDRISGLAGLGVLGRLLRQRQLGTVWPVPPVYLGLAVPGATF